MHFCFNLINYFMYLRLRQLKLYVNSNLLLFITITRILVFQVMACMALLMLFVKILLGVGVLNRVYKTYKNFKNTRNIYF